MKTTRSFPNRLFTSCISDTVTTGFNIHWQGCGTSARAYVQHTLILLL